MKNLLFCGDNLEILRDHIADESVDLVYLDPPFNSSRSYNMLFESKADGTRHVSQKQAFHDTWEWNTEAEKTFHALIETPTKLAETMTLFRALLGESDMLAYLSMMAPRLVELRRTLRPSGSLYLHCDPTASHYLKVLLDAVFGGANFRNEIVWKRSDAHNDAKQGAKHFGRVHDILLFYTKTDQPFFKPLYRPLPKTTADKWYRHIEEGTGRRYNKADVTGPGGAAKGNPFYEWNGIKRYWRYSREKMEALHASGKLVYSRTGMTYEKRYLDESRGVSIQDWWDDISMLRGISAKTKSERVGYPTQKPLALLRRIIEASTNPGDVVLDPFCGCGTAIEAAHDCKRRWIGIDIAELAMDVIRGRLKKSFNLIPPSGYQIIREPGELACAEALASEDHFGFQKWAVKKLGGNEPQRGADRGVDGMAFFLDFPGDPPQKIVFSVKAGKHVSPAFVRELRGTATRERAAIGVLVTLIEPTKAMLKEAASAGVYKSMTGTFPRIQICTAAEILNGDKMDSPPLLKAMPKKSAASADIGQLRLPGVGTE